MVQRDTLEFLVKQDCQVCLENQDPLGKMDVQDLKDPLYVHVLVFVNILSSKYPFGPSRPLGPGLPLKPDSPFKPGNPSIPSLPGLPESPCPPVINKKYKYV
jgi:hypothetical protein